MTEREACETIVKLLGPASTASTYNMGRNYQVRGYDAGWEPGEREWAGSGETWAEAVEDLKDHLREFYAKD